MGTPFFILATGQSNIELQFPYSWAPNARAKQWNNIIDNDTSIGTAYVPLSSSEVGIAARYAHDVAVADPNKDVYLARYTRGARDILHWLGGGFFNFGSGPSGPGIVNMNAAPESATVMTMSNIDSLGVRRPFLTSNALVGEYIWFIAANGVIHQYVITGPQAWNLDQATFPIYHIAGSGALTGNVQICFQPRFTQAINSSVPAALAAAGKSTIDVLLWWQCESDAQYNSRYEIEFEFLMGYYASQPWWGADTKVVMCGMNSTANNGMPTSDAMNSRLAALASSAANRRFAPLGTAMPANAWRGFSIPDDPYHMTAEGYIVAADYIHTSVYAPPLVDTGGGGGTDTITSMSVGALTTVMDVRTNANHGALSDGNAYGLWIDGSPHPYRDGNGNKYIVLPHSENYRFLVGDWNNGATWTLQGTTLEGARNTTEGAYNNRNWVFGIWSNGSTVYSLIHHEWYVNNRTSDGIAGFNGLNIPYNPSTFNRQWVNALSWAQSSNGGRNFATSTSTNSNRLVLVPEPWGVQSKNHMYGYFHPSNIVKEGSWYYAAVEQRSLNADGSAANSGVSLVRTQNLATPTGWQFWSGSAWVTVDHASYQGNLAAQQPYRFFAQNNHNYYLSAAYNSHMGQCLRYHTPSGQWVMFGFAGTMASRLCYSLSPTLANPQFATINPVTTPNPEDYNSSAGRYISVFDELATDNNYINIGNTCTVLVTNGSADGAPDFSYSYSQVRKGALTIGVNAPTATYSINTFTTTIGEGGTVTYVVNTTNVPDGTLLYWTNVGTTDASDFTDGLNSASFSVNSGTATITRTLVSDSVAEGAETIALQVRVGSTVGTVVATAPTVTVSASGSGAPTYSFGVAPTTVSEGGVITYSITTTNVGSTTLYWANEGTSTGADFTDGQNSGSVSIVNNSGSFTRTVASDSVTEGAETVIMTLRTGSVTGPVVATAANVTISADPVVTGALLRFRNAANTAWINANQYNVRIRNADNTAWIQATPSMLRFRDPTNAYWITPVFETISLTYSITPSVTTVDAGASVVFNITTNDTSGNPLYWYNVGTTNGADFDSGLNFGVVPMANGVGTFSLKVLQASNVEHGETIIINLRDASGGGGNLLATAATVTVNRNNISYAISPSSTSVNEGGTVTYTVTCLNFGSGTLYWTNAGTSTAADFNDNANSGSVTISGDTGTFSRVLKNDATTEGSETIVMQLRTVSVNGTVVVTAVPVTVVDSSVAAPATFAISPNVSSVNEGGTVTYTITCTGYGSGTLYWTNAGTSLAADFTDGQNSGSVTITSNSGSFTRTLVNDLATEGNETMVMQLRTTSTSGTVVATASSVTVVDTSVTPPYTPPNPYTISLVRNDLDFIYAPDVTHNGGNYLQLDFVINFDDFFTAGANHIPIAINAKITNPHTNHCGPITRNGRNLFSYARGFFIRPGTNQIYAEYWNGTSSPVIELVPKTSGFDFDPAVNTQVRVRIIGGLRTGPYAEQMLIYIRTMDYSKTLFHGSRAWGWDPESVYMAAIGGIGSNFVTPNDTGCIEKTGAGSNPSASLIVSDITHAMYST